MAPEIAKDVAVPVPLRAVPRLLLAANRAILTNASSLVGTTAVTSGLGIGYWWLAAHRFPSSVVGFAAASIAAMILLGTVSMVGFGTLLIGQLPREDSRRGALIGTALAVAGTVGSVLGTLFAIVAPGVSDNFRPLAGSVGSVVLFAAGVGLTAIALVLDQALIGLLRGALQFWRNALFAAVKLVALLVAGLWWSDGSGLTIYATWAIGNLISLGALAALATRRGAINGSYRPEWRMLRGMGRAALGHHGLNLALQVTGLMMPLVVTALLSATTNAHFYIAWMVASFVFVGPLALSTVLYAVGAATPAVLGRKLRFTLGVATVIGVLANAVLVIGADRILHVFGAGYAQEASQSLRIMGLVVFPLIVKDHYVTLGRIHGRMASTALLVMAGSLLELTLGAIGATLGGLSGLSLGLLAAMSLEAAFMARTVFRTALCADTPQAPTPLSAE